MLIKDLAERQQHQTDHMQAQQEKHIATLLRTQEEKSQQMFEQLSIIMKEMMATNFSQMMEVMKTMIPSLQHSPATNLPQESHRPYMDTQNLFPYYQDPRQHKQLPPRPGDPRGGRFPGGGRGRGINRLPYPPPLNDATNQGYTHQKYQGIIPANRRMVPQANKFTMTTHKESTKAQ